MVLNIYVGAGLPVLVTTFQALTQAQVKPAPTILFNF